jgi:hypothetical protein
MRCHRRPETRKAQGRYISGLLRAEYARQEERKRLKAGIERVFAESAS